METKVKKWAKVGSILKGKQPNKDGSDSLYIKFEEGVIIEKGNTLSLWTPHEKAPDFVVFDVMKKNE